jgi:hypothetical protein
MDQRRNDCKVKLEILIIFTIVFGSLIIDRGLLLELVALIAKTMSSLYCRLRWLVHPYFDAIT